jgi:hypothetical protein
LCYCDWPEIAMGEPLLCNMTIHVKHTESVTLLCRSSSEHANSCSDSVDLLCDKTYEVRFLLYADLTALDEHRHSHSEARPRMVCRRRDLNCAKW